MGKPPRHKSFTERNEALPEPRRVKRSMLEWRTHTHQAAREYANHRHIKNFRRFKGAIFEWYLNVRPFLDEMDGGHRDYSKLREIDGWIGSDQEPEDDELWQCTTLLEHLMKDLGVTNIGISRKEYDFGFEFLEGLPFEMEKEDEGWRRLKENVRNMDCMLREDTDFMMIVTGPNRVGKDTLALQICAEADERFSRENMVVDDDDFWHAVDELPQYSWIELTELSDHFYSKNAMKGDQKKKKRKLKKFAAQNMSLVGCDLNWFNIDREVLEDKATINIHVPRRGRFEFYTREQIKEFEKDSDTGECVRPSPAFSGRFPKAPGADTVQTLKEQYDNKKEVGEHLKEKEDAGKELRLYEQYAVKEAEKFKVNKEEVEKDEVNVHQVAKQVKDKLPRYKKKYGDGYIIDKPLLKADFDEVGEEEARQVKSLVETELGWRNDED